VQLISFLFRKPQETLKNSRQGKNGSKPVKVIYVDSNLLQITLAVLFPRCFGNEFAVCLIRIRSDPELFAGSGSAIQISDPDSERIRNRNLEKN